MYCTESHVVEYTIKSFMHKDLEVNLPAFIYRVFHENLR